MTSSMTPERIAGIAPVAPSVTLLQAARRLPAGTVWQSGITWRSAACATAQRVAYCNDEDGAALNAAPDITQPAFFPYQIVVPYACDWILPGQEAEYRADAEAQAEAATAWNVARELWTGETEADNPSLMSVASDASAAGAVHPTTALGLLLEAYEDCGQAGGALVHAPTQALVSLLHSGVVKQNGDVIYGPNGSIVSSGPGYPGAGDFGPGGGASGDGNEWVYVSGPVEYELGAIEVVPDDAHAHFDRRRNRYEVWAQRSAIHRFDPCCVFAVKTYVPSPTQGEAP